MATVGRMSSPEVCPDTANEHAAADLIAVGVYPTFAAGSEHGLVVLAMGRPYWLVVSGDAFALLVETAGHVAVREQLARFDRESVGWPPPPLEVGARVRPSHLLLPMLWTIALFAAYWGQQEWPETFAAGTLDARAVFTGGEWWRAVTALFLHADSGHLVSNALSGIFVFAVIAATLGTVRGWLLLFAAAVAGNLASAAAQYPDDYRSLGASTAVFAGLGILTGRALRVALRGGAAQRWQAIGVPFGAGLTVLALFGAGGQRVDLGAHVCGFAAGLLLGFLGTPRTTPAATPSGRSL